jgi:hypothetical protein
MYDISKQYLIHKSNYVVMVAFPFNFSLRRMRPEKTEAPCHSKCGTIKSPACSEALSAEYRPKVCSSSRAMVTSPYISEKFLNETYNSK